VAEVKLAVTARTEFGKGAARRTRRAGLIPAVIYGHGAAPVHVSLPTHETFMALKHANALFSLELDRARGLDPAGRRRGRAGRGRGRGRGGCRRSRTGRIGRGGL